MLMMADVRYIDFEGIRRLDDATLYSSDIIAKLFGVCRTSVWRWVQNNEFGEEFKRQDKCMWRIRIPGSKIKSMLGCMFKPENAE